MMHAATLMGLLAAGIGLSAGYVRGRFVAPDDGLPPEVAARAAVQRRLYYLFFGLAVLGLGSGAGVLLAFNVAGADLAYAPWCAGMTGALLLLTAGLAAATWRGMPR